MVGNNRIHVYLFVAALMVLFFSRSIALAAAIRIMPLGDSITRGTGSTDMAGYRRPLYNRLVGPGGYETDFVGSLRDGPNTFDNQHEGHGGFTAAQIALQTFAWLSANPTEVVLLHAGTNQVEENTVDLEKILDELDDFDENTWVVLALIIDRYPHSPTTSAFNRNLLRLAEQRIANGDKIVVVDQELALDYPEDMSDQLHPNDFGYGKMAEAWFLGLLEILPRADAGGDQEANPNVAVTLNGSGSSDAIAAITSYSWRQSGGNPAVTLLNADTSKAVFMAPSIIGGTALSFDLAITDSKQFSHQDSCTVNVNGPPIAVAGLDQFVNPAASVVLDGADSFDLNGAIASFQWTQTAGNPVVTLTGANSQTTVFTSPDAGSGGAVLTFRLTVTDDKGATSSDSCVVRINGRPLADAGPDQKVRSEVPVILDGSGSTDEGGDALSYIWEQISGPAVVLTDPASINPNFIFPFTEISSVLLEFRLTVTDSGGLQATDTCSVEVWPTASGDSQGSTSSGGGGGGCFVTAAGGWRTNIPSSP